MSLRMLANVSYSNRELTKKVDDTVGKPFSLKERWAMGGIGSPKFLITTCSVEIRNLLILDNNLDSCNVELRPKGIIIRFRSLLETFALVIPYYKLSIYKGEGHVYSIHINHHFIRIQSDSPSRKKFIKRIIEYKAQHAPSSLEDL